MGVQEYDPGQSRRFGPGRVVDAPAETWLTRQMQSSLDAGLAGTAAKDKFGYDQALQAGELQSRAQLAQVQNRGETNRARIAANASMYPANMQMERFNRLFPFLRGQLGGGAWSKTVGGQSGPSPEITVGPVLNPQQIQQQVNAMRAQNDQKAQGQVAQAQQRMAGAGFSGSSPLLQELQARAQGQAMQSSTQGENDLRYQAAQGNQQAILAGQQARSGQFAERMQEDIERRKTSSGTYNALLAALSSMV